MLKYGNCLEGSNGKNTVSAHDFELRAGSIQIAFKQKQLDNDAPTRLHYNREDEIWKIMPAVQIISKRLHGEQFIHSEVYQLQYTYVCG